jgi:hypothetical protein
VPTAEEREVLRERSGREGGAVRLEHRQSPDEEGGLKTKAVLKSGEK